jgi:hypothetical protein
VATVERQQMEQRLQQLGDDAAAAQQDASREMDGLRVQLAAKEAAHRWASLTLLLSRRMQQLLLLCLKHRGVMCWQCSWLQRKLHIGTTNAV